MRLACPTGNAGSCISNRRGCRLTHRVGALGSGRFVVAGARTRDAVQPIALPIEPMTPSSGEPDASRLAPDSGS